VFIAAFMVFIGLFSQSIQSAVAYQQHSGLSTKVSDLLDTMLLNPGENATWGTDGTTPSAFGLQAPEFTEYQLSPFSLMRLDCSTADMVEYQKTTPNIYYSSLESGFGASLVTPQAQEINYSKASMLLGINNTYAFQLTLTPDITIAINETCASSPLSLTMVASGTGFPLASATINYCLILVTLPQNQYPSYTIQSGAVTTDQLGIANVTFSSVVNPDQVYAFVAYGHLDGLVGVGYHTRDTSTSQYIVPIVENMTSQQVVLAHNYDLNDSNSPQASLNYNATFLISTEDYSLTTLSLGSPTNPGVVGTVTSGVGNPYSNVTLPTSTTGILIVTYQQGNTTQGGVVMMPWGISSLAFPVTFGANPAGQSWVATDIRQVTVGGVAYQARLALWSQTTQVTG